MSSAAPILTKGRCTLTDTNINDYVSFCEGRNLDTLATFMNRYYQVTDDIVSAHGGSVYKFIGDRILALWKPAVPPNKNAEAALVAAVEQQKRTEELNSWLKEQSFPQIKIRIAIATDDTAIAFLGQRILATGRAFKLLELASGVAKKQGERIVLTSSSTCEIRDREFAYVADLQVAGNAEPVKLYSYRFA